MTYKKYMPVLLFVLFMCVIYSIGIIRFNRWHHNMDQIYIKQVNDCKSKSNEYISEQEREYCTNMINNRYFVITYAETKEFYEEYIPLSSNFLIILIIVIASCFYNSKYLKSNRISYDLTRESYHQVKKKLFMNAWLPALVVPLFMIIKLFIAFLLCFIQKGNFGMLLWQTTPTFNFNYLLVDIIIAFLDCLIFTNICLIITRKQHRFILSTVLSCLTIIGLELFLEYIVNGIFISRLMHKDFGIIFNIITFGHLSDSCGLLPPLLVSLGIFFISLIVVFISYKEKEKLIIDCEKNN